MIDGVGLLTYRDRLDKLKLTTLLERRVRGDLIEMFKIQEGFVSYGSELFGRAGRTVAARSKPHRFTTNETDFFAQRVLCYWNSLPALVKASESVTSFGLVDIKPINLAITQKKTIILFVFLTHRYLIKINI